MIEIKEEDLKYINKLEESSLKTLRLQINAIKIKEERVNYIKELLVLLPDIIEDFEYIPETEMWNPSINYKINDYEVNITLGEEIVFNVNSYTAFRQNYEENKEKIINRIKMANDCMLCNAYPLSLDRDTITNKLNPINRYFT